MGRHDAARWVLGAILSLGCALENPSTIVPAEAGVADLGTPDVAPDQPAPQDTPPADLGPECGALGQRCCSTSPACREGDCGANGFCVTCATSERLCDGRCVDLQSDNAHCGACGTACATDGSTVCARGQCILSSCPTGRGDCNRDPADACETTLADSPSHCGTCGNACLATNGRPACVAGACQLAECNTGFRDCDGLQSTGCEVDIARSLAHCGSCGMRCAPANTDVARCEEGRCFVTTCTRLFGDCNTDPDDGCETDLARSIEHCGACGVRCSAAGGTAVCNVGVCGVSRCDAGRGDCDNNAGNGCETNLRDTVAHCGACGAACGALAHATVVCRDARCAIGTCDTGWGDCNGNPSDGCETDLRVTTTACGSCDLACSLTRAVPRCASSTCAVASCEMGFGNCDSRADNGCEVNVTNTLAHCGACNNNCPGRNNASRTCNGGNCGFQCNGGFGNCDNRGDNGCEINLNTSLAHCGGCGRTCTAPNGGTAACNNGNCVRSCPNGQQNCGGTCRPAGACTSPGGGGCQRQGSLVCNGNNSVCDATPRTNGNCTSPAGGMCRNGGVCGCPGGQTNCGNACRNLNTDTQHCGSCGRVCAPASGGTATCSGGDCGQACPGGQSNCGGTCRNLTNSPQHCGGCGRACLAGQECVSSTCRCPSGTALCGGACVTLATNPNHCGACDVRCGSGTCANSACVCPMGQRACGTNPIACVDPMTDPRNCGGCGTVCTSPMGRCVAGACAAD